MRVSNLLLIVPIMANTALGAIAIYIDEGNGGIVNFSYEAAYWTGPPTDDFSGDLPGFDTCQIQSPGSSCEVGGYKLTLSATGVSGCNQGVDVESGQSFHVYHSYLSYPCQGIAANTCNL